MTDATIRLFEYSKAPTDRARRYFWIKIVIVNLSGLTFMILAAVFETWLMSHKFVFIVSALIVMVSIIAFAVCWHFNEPCPRCGWNINLSKDPMRRPLIFVPKTCVNCGENLKAEPKRAVAHPD
jgi:hypothetical protein